jgi:hypothetical protein
MRRDETMVSESSSSLAVNQPTTPLQQQRPTLNAPIWEIPRTINRQPLSPRAMCRKSNVLSYAL